MSAFSDYLEGKIVDATLRGIAFPTLTAIWIGAATAAPTDSGTLNEASGTSYARVSVACSTANWSAHGASGPASNANAITFPQAGGAWGTITHIFASDASAAGNLLLKGALSVSKSPTTGDTLTIPANDFDLSLD